MTRSSTSAARASTTSRRRRRRAPRRARRLHRRLRLRQVVARLRHDLRRGPAPLLRVGRALRPAAANQVGAPEVERDHGAAAGGRAAAAARRRRRRARRSGRSRRCRTCCGCCSRGPAPTRAERDRARGRGVLPQHGGRRVPGMPRARQGPRRDRAAARARPVAEHPRGRGRRVAGRVAGPEPARHPRRRSATTSTRPWRELPQEDRDWILFTDEQPRSRSTRASAPVDADYTYNGTFSSAERHVMHTLANSASAAMRERRCASSHDRLPGLPRQAAAARGAGGDLRGRDIAELAALPLQELAAVLLLTAELADPEAAYLSSESGETTEVAVQHRARPASRRIEVLVELGLGYLSVDRTDADALARASCSACGSRPSCAPGCSAWSTCSTSRRPGCTPRTPSRCCGVLDRLKAAGNSLFVVEHDLDVVRRADWVVDVGPAPASAAASVLYSGPVDGPGATSTASVDAALPVRPQRRPRPAHAARALRLAAPARHQSPQPARRRRRSPARRPHRGHRRLGLGQVDAWSPRCSPTWCGAGSAAPLADEDGRRASSTSTPPQAATPRAGGVRSPGARRPEADRPHAALEPRDLHRALRRRAQGVRRHRRGARPRLDAGRFSFNVPAGRCPTCQGEGFVAVELLFLPGTYAPCPTCHGARYNPETLEVTLPRHERSPTCWR